MKIVRIIEKPFQPSRIDMDVDRPYRNKILLIVGAITLLVVVIVVLFQAILSI